MLDTLVLTNLDGKYDHNPNGLWYDKVIKTYFGIKWTQRDKVPVSTKRYQVGATQSGQAFGGTGGTAARTSADGFIWQATWSVGTSVASGGLEFGTSTGLGIPVTAGQAYSIGFYDIQSNKSVRVAPSITFYDASNAAVGSTSTGSGLALTGGAAAVSITGQLNNVVAPAGATHAVVKLYSTSGTGSAVWAVNDWLRCSQPQVTLGTSLGSPDRWDGSKTLNYPKVYSWAGDSYDSMSIEDTITSYNYTYNDYSWETQTGEFVIDEIVSQHFPDTVTIKGRDYVAKLMSSEFKVDTAFTASDQLEDVIKSIATNGRIDPLKIIVPTTNIALGKDFYFESGSSRWDAIKTLANSFNYEVYFDASGFLTMRTFREPVTSPLSFSFRTGPNEGSVANWEKRTSRTQMFNVVVVTGEATDTIPVYGIAENHSPSSPTSIENLNQESVYKYTSSFITTTQQAQDLANSWLNVYSLEDYDLSLETLILPWLEVGDIIEFIQESDAGDDPTRFLWSSFTIPFALGTMSGTGKRVTIVG